MSDKFMRRGVALRVSCAAMLAVLWAAPSWAQFEPANHFPSKPVDDGKFLALAGTRFATLSGGNLSFGLVVPPSTPESTHACEAPLTGECIYLGIFDGDTTGESADAAAIADYADLESLFPSLPDPEVVPSVHHWDNLTADFGAGGLVIPTVTGLSGTQLGFALFADPNQVASTKKKDFLGAWMGDHTDNLSRNDVSDPQWIAFAGDFEDPGFSGRGADLTGFPDNGWWNLELEVNGCEAGDPGCPLAANGVSSYHLCIFYNPAPAVFPAALAATLAGYGDEDEVVELCSGIFDESGVVRADPYPTTVSLFKLKGETDVQLLSRSFAFEGGQHNLADTTSLFPEWTPLLTQQSSPSYDSDFFLNATTKYDGEWVFNLFLPPTSPRRELVVFDGDFDYGTLDTVGDPSGDLFAACADDADADSPASPAFVVDLGPQIACVPGSCSVTTTLSCTNAGDCPGGESCVRPPPDPVYGELCVCSDLPAGVTTCSLDGSIDEGAKAFGVPADDTLFDQFRRIASPDGAVWPEAERKCVVYEVRSPGVDGDLDTPDDVLYRNPNPSSQREWEQFRIVSRCEVVDTDPDVRECGCSNTIPGLTPCPAGYPASLEEVFDPSKTDAEQADVVVDDPQLPGGTWRVTVYGVDLSNLNVWSTELVFCPPDSPFCTPPLPPYKVGDTVWEDTDGDAKQSLGESGIPGIKVNLIEAGQTLATKSTGDEGLDALTSCEDCNTGGDPFGPADPVKAPVDEFGLYCFDLEIPRVCSLTTSQGCSDTADCPAGEICGPPPGNHCSVTTAQDCSVDDDCPVDETCVPLGHCSGAFPAQACRADDDCSPGETCEPYENCRDLVVEVDPTNFAPGGPLDGYGPTATSPTKDCQICEAAGGAVTLNCDFGYAPCDECDGKISRLTLQYMGAAAATIRVEQKKGATVFGPSLVQPGGYFAFTGLDNQGTLGPDIDIYVDGAFHVRIHTSCSQPIFAGLIKGDFRVASGISRFGGPLCPGENGTDCGCEGKVSFLRLQYNGSAPAIVLVEQKNGVALFGPTSVAPGEQFDLGAGTYNDTYGTDIRVYVDGALHTSIHTSCSQPIGPGLVKGDFEVISGRSKLAGDLCPVDG